MRSKKPFLYIAAGVVTAVVAVLVVNKQLSTASASPPEAERVDLLLALRDMGYGERLVLQDHGENPNVQIVAWPTDVAPPDAVRDAKAITEQEMRARSDIAQHELILGRRIAATEDFVPADMCRERVSVDNDDITSGRLRAGMKVDVLKIVDNRPVKFMRCVRIYAIGRLDLFGQPMQDEGVQPNVFMLIKKADQLAFIEAQLRYAFRLVETSGPCGAGPELVDPSTTPAMRRQTAEGLLASARRLTAAGQHEQALAELDNVIKEYSDLTTVCTEATVLAGQCREAAANGLYEAAKRAYESDKQYSIALQLLARIDRDYAEVEQVVLRAAELRSAVEAAQRKQERQASYQGLLHVMDAALARGNLPLTSEKLTELKAFEAEGFRPEGDVIAPADAVRDLGARLRKEESRYDLEKQVLESYLKNDKLAQAREKLRQMKEEFPDHPDMAQLGKAVTEASGP